MFYLHVYRTFLILFCLIAFHIYCFASSENKRLYYTESFQNVKSIDQESPIQQTDNWKLSTACLQELNSSKDTSPIAQKQEEHFVVKSNIPLEYSFVQSLLEQKYYRYVLSVNVMGKGVISLGENGSQFHKEQTIDSPSIITIEQNLGDGSTYNKKVVPFISFQGDIKIESISIFVIQLNSNITNVLGEIEDISNVPDIKKADYPDCFYTARLRVLQIFNGAPVSNYIQLLIPAFRNNQIDPLSKTMKKGFFYAAIKPLSSATPDEQLIEQVDEIDSFTLPPFILVDATTSSVQESNGSAIPILSSVDYISPYDHPINPPIAQKYLDDSNELISKELIKVNAIIDSVEQTEGGKNTINAAFNDSWNTTQKKYEPIASNNVWAKIGDSYFSLPQKWTFIRPGLIYSYNLDALAELNSFFKTQGILFIVQIIPDFRDISALVLNPDFQKYGDYLSALVTRQLLEKGIETHYLSDAIVKNALNYERCFFYPSDYHPAEGAVDIMTSKLAERLRLFDDCFTRNLKEELFTVIQNDVGMKSIKWPANCDIGSHTPGTVFQTPYYYYDDKRIKADPTSKILIIGNSFIQEPYDKDAYIAYLAKKMLYSVDSKPMQGISALSTLPNIIITEYNSLIKNKTVVVLPISVHFLTTKKTFSNVKELDRIMSQSSEQNDYLFSITSNTNMISIFPSSFNFSIPFYRECLSRHPSLACLSVEQPECKIKIPNPETRHLYISIQPIGSGNCNISVNNKLYQLNPTVSPYWQILKIDLEEECNSCSISIDKDTFTNKDFILIGNISGYK